MSNPFHLRSFQDGDEAAIVALWETCGLTRPWNNPMLDIARKKTVQPDLFLVATLGASPHATIVGAAMVGYDGHRGWVNYLAVHPSHQRQGLARQIMQQAEQKLIALGCPKLNLQVRTGNTQVLAFYEALGYAPDATVSLGKRLIVD